MYFIYSKARDDSGVISDGTDEWETAAINVSG